MNRMFIVIFSLAMLLALATGTQGAVHSGASDFSTYGMSMAEIFDIELGADSWYTTTPEDPYFKAAYFRIEDTVSRVSGEYYLSDFTFAGIGYTVPDSSTSVEWSMGLLGSYLFDFGLFVGLEYGFMEPGPTPPAYESYYNLSVGYCYELGENSYIALSVNYNSVPDVDFSEIVGYDIDLVYYFDNGRAYFQYYLPTDENTILDDDAYDLGVAFLVAEEIVLGFNYSAADTDYEYDLGLTWSPAFMVLDFQYGGTEMDDDNFYAVGALFHLNELFHLGFNWNQPNNAEAQVTLKFKYTTDMAQFLLAYVLENDDDPARYYLAYKMTL